MCRWIAYVGDAVYLEDFVSLPRQSLVAQSQRARESRTDVNGDGFGIGWFGERARPGIFRDIRPAWSDENLISMAHQIRSRLFFAHVRASTGTASTRANCHPFAVGQWLFMHNGQIGGYARIKRRLEQEIPDELFEHRLGTTDSEVIFLLLLANGLEHDPDTALQRTLATIERHMRDAGIVEPLRFTATRQLPGGRGMLIVSEPLDGVREGWTAVPPQHAITATAQDITLTALPAATRLAQAA
jgi:predicted glutamine amidotransferase